jgi:opacity protein-like surface antigen
MKPTCLFTSLTLFFIFIFSVNQTQSQITYSSKAKSPVLTIEIAGSYNLPIMDAGGTLKDYFAFQSYGASLGWGAQFNFKFGLGAKGQYRPYISLGFSQLQGSDDNLAYIDSNYISKGYPLKGSAQYKSTPGKSNIIYRIPYVGVGFEYAFVEANKKRTFIPFIGVGFTVNIINGMYRQTPTTSARPEYSGLEIPFTIKTDVRIGITAGAGADIKLTKSFGLTFGTKFQYSNLIAKNSSFLMEENKMNLLDKADTDLNTKLSKDRNIGYMEFYLGVCFLIGKSNK